MDIVSVRLKEGLCAADDRRLQDYLQALEDEQRKIEAFKRELPLCMHIITDAIRAVKQLGSTPSSSSTLKLGCISYDDSSACKQTREQDKTSSAAAAVRPRAIPGALILNPIQSSGGAFSPFVRTSLAKGAEQPQQQPQPQVVSTSDAPARSSSADGESPSTSAARTGSSNHNQRKSRRCWSPELHRRFIAALEQLGGSHVATPKQIRELMKVEGLTNDEVKSHLQKYRLHTRRPNAGSMMFGSQTTPQLVIWVPPEFQHCSTKLEMYKEVAAAAAAAPAAACRDEECVKSSEESENE